MSRLLRGCAVIFLECIAACIAAYIVTVLLVRIGVAIVRTWRGY